MLTGNKPPPETGNYVFLETALRHAASLLPQATAGVALGGGGGGGAVAFPNHTANAEAYAWPSLALDALPAFELPAANAAAVSLTQLGIEAEPVVFPTNPADEDYTAAKNVAEKYQPPPECLRPNANLLNVRSSFLLTDRERTSFIVAQAKYDPETAALYVEMPPYNRAQVAARPIVKNGAALSVASLSVAFPNACFLRSDGASSLSYLFFALSCHTNKAVNNFRPTNTLTLTISAAEFVFERRERPEKCEETSGFRANATRWPSHDENIHGRTNLAVCFERSPHSEIPDPQTIEQQILDVLEFVKNTTCYSKTRLMQLADSAGYLNSLLSFRLRHFGFAHLSEQQKNQFNGAIKSIAQEIINAWMNTRGARYCPNSSVGQLTVIFEDEIAAAKHEKTFAIKWGDLKISASSTLRPAKRARRAAVQ
ncbi:MAG: hypothetical protein V4623_05515 [Pseudomonadota bacterium]